jgi:heme/copper-type cytochrome/quinol oxidase subunit 2
VVLVVSRRRRSRGLGGRTRRHGAAAQRADARQFAAWVLIVIILPVLGTMLYFVIGRQPKTRMS